MSAAMYHAHMTVAQQLLHQLQHITTPPRVAVTEQVLVEHLLLLASQRSKQRDSVPLSPRDATSGNE